MVQQFETKRRRLMAVMQRLRETFPGATIAVRRGRDAKRVIRMEWAPGRGPELGTVEDLRAWLEGLKTA